jgi:nucleotide-binding universal stress UspA family protein
MRIVVGVSAGTGSPNALRWAADLARQVDGHLRAVMAWREPRPPAAPGMHPPAVARTGPDQPAHDAEERLARLVAAALGDDHKVECVVEEGGPVRVLRRASRDADLLVLDSPRQEKLIGISSGKLVAPRLLYRSACPVVTMPSSGRGPSGLRRLAAAVADSAGRAGRAGLPPLSASSDEPLS